MEPSGVCLPFNGMRTSKQGLRSSCCLPVFHFLMNPT